MPQARESSLAATAQLEGWRQPVDAALQPVLLVDAAGHVCAASPAATRLLVLPSRGGPLVGALGLRDLAGEWDSTPFAQVMVTGQTQRGRLELPTGGLSLDVVANPLFGATGVIGAMVFLTSR